ncbi:MAG: PsbP-related protein [bacterium]|nr:PsbP-related protein [bacterium]
MNSQKGNINIVLMVIIVALVGALVYLVAVPKGQENGTPAPSPTPSPASQDETAGWKTYRNEEYGFEVKYPSDWETRKCTTILSSGDIQVPKNECQGFGPYEGMVDEVVDVTIVNGSLSDAKQISLVKSGQQTSIQKEEQAEINGNIWTKITIRNDISGSIAISHIKTVQSATYAIGLGAYFGTPVDDTGNLEIYNDILSTFKFTSTHETAGWKTYRNEEYGFELRHPQDLIATEVDTKFSDDIVSWIVLDKTKFIIRETEIFVPIELQVRNADPKDFGIENGIKYIIKIDDVSGTKIVYTDSLSGNNSAVVIVKQGDKFWVLRTMDSANYGIIFDLLLSTFKFTK